MEEVFQGLKLVSILSAQKDKGSVKYTKIPSQTTFHLKNEEIPNAFEGCKVLLNKKYTKEKQSLIKEGHIEFLVYEQIPGTKSSKL